MTKYWDKKLSTITIRAHLRDWQVERNRSGKRLIWVFKGYIYGDTHKIYQDGSYFELKDVVYSINMGRTLFKRSGEREYFVADDEHKHKGI